MSLGSKKQRENYKQIVAKAKSRGCVHCGSRKDLQFHHIDPSTKLFDVGSKTELNQKYLKEEIAKCIVLCNDCHIEEHRKL